ncbi:MAG: aminomethyl-transferring glycine dehydrogenase subunit GcvPB [Clostridiales Family XIII bacterium]|jgi:glycine dehydrogenase subunit 2|nr:aminomethyl-transferring glycine dehydrogenase subunit GcvPB [Clostridiales Family XIII bacterium]
MTYDYDKTIFELSAEGKQGYRLPPVDGRQGGGRQDAAPTNAPDTLRNVGAACSRPPEIPVIPESLRRAVPPLLPQVSEPEAVRHFTRLSQKNYGVDGGFYPLGSCTMKYNPKVNEEVCALPGFAGLHPYQPAETAQGALQLLHELGEAFCAITGMDEFSLQPAAGAHGELAGLMIIKNYHASRGEGHRKTIIVPDSSHGTNPASAAEAGYHIVQIDSNADGTVCLAALETALADGDIAGLMLTNPNTLGLFEKDILKIAELVHAAGGLLYYDGANLNAILGEARPGDMGFDVMHINTHKTFSTPHGGGGPGAGPIGVKAHLSEFLPTPRVVKDGDAYRFEDVGPNSIGKLRGYFGSFGVLARAWTYIRTMGAAGMKEVSEAAVLNANYMKEALKGPYKLPYDHVCMHEFVLDGLADAAEGVKTVDVAKRLIELGYHPPTIYFPLIVHNALMIEPTETESKETLDAFLAAMRQIADEAAKTPEVLTAAPGNTPVTRVDELRAAKTPKLKWEEVS